MKQVIIRVPEELHKAVKLKSFESEVSVNDAVNRFLTQWAEGKVLIEKRVSVSMSHPKEEVKVEPQVEPKAESPKQVQVESAPKKKKSWIDQLNEMPDNV